MYVFLVRTFGGFIYFAFPASTDNMGEMRSLGGGEGSTPLQEANRDLYAAGCGRIFTTGVTIMGTHFQ